MSLLQNQEFVIYRIRNRYLQCMRDGVGERLITVNPTSLNVPGFRNAGWGNPSDIKRTHSPPIPVGTSAAEYFAAAPKSAGEPPAGFNDAEEEQEKGLGPPPPPITQDIIDLVPARLARGDRIPSRMRELMREEDDSTDPSDDSDDEMAQGSTQSLKFTKWPLRTRSGSSPIRSGPQVFVTSPNSKPRDSRTRAGSHGPLDLTRTSNTTSSSNNTAPNEGLLSTRVKDADSERFRVLTERLHRSPAPSFQNQTRLDLEDSDDDSDTSTTLSSDFTETADSNPAMIGNAISTQIAVGPSSPSILHALPPPRPISQIQPVSALTQLLKTKETQAVNPMDQFRTLSGVGELPNLTISLKIYFTKCKEPRKPLEVILKRVSLSKDSPTPTREVAVYEAIGYSLYKYIEEEREPPLTEEECDINMWALKMVEDDGEPDDDFPPLIRTRPVSSYLVKDRRVDKLAGEFAIVEATPSQYEEHQRVTPSQRPSPRTIATASAVPQQLTSNLLLAPSERQIAVDAASSNPSSTARTGPSKILRIFINSIDEFAQSVSLCVTTDTYIAEVLEQVCKKRRLEKSTCVLKLHGKNILAPLDRTVESLGDNSDLELVKRKFSDVLGDRPGSPSSGDPNTPLLVNAMPFTSKKKRLLQPATTPDMLSSAGYQKFIVWRKQPMSFMSRHERVLAIDGEYVHILPSDQKTFFESPKTTNIHIRTIIGCKVSRKIPTSFKIAVLKPQPREQKRYDFETASAQQSAEIVAALKKQIESFKMDKQVLY